MAKTLADMAAEERADCVGMWALIERVDPAVIVEADETDACVVIYPGWKGCNGIHLNEMVTPRFDLPRAWTPGGEPELAQALAEETYEYTYHIKRQGEWEPTRNMETHRQDWWDDRIEVVETVELLRASGFETRIVRRRVSPPEVINE